MTPVILIVEDEADLVELLRYNLEREGYEILATPSGEEALLIVEERHVDLMLLDWMLPHMSGIEVLSESEAEAAGIAFECARFDVAELDRAKTEALPAGFVKVLTKPGSDRILGVTIVSAHAGESIAEFVLAMKYGLGLKKIMGTIHIYPTWTEMNKFVAGVWQKAHKPNWALPWLARYHRFRRGG